MVIQEKYDLNGQLKRWNIDEEEIKKIVSWASKHKGLIAKELQEMKQYFPYFYLTLSTESKINQGNIFCPQCNDLLTIAEGSGLTCICCSALYNPPQSSMLGWVGQLPSLVGQMTSGEFGERGNVRGRPFLKKIHSEIRGKDGSNKDWLKSHFMVMENKIYFAPTIYAFYPQNWPRGGPRIMVSKEYFDDILFVGSHRGHSDFHAYNDSGHNLLQLCLYSSWHQMTMRNALQQRIVPKIIIDLMIADLVTVGKLDRVVSSLGASVHSLYNWIGKSDRSERFKREYDKHVQID
ncbi:hypothetical protein ACFL1Y_00030 [Patescibacteria group bacterium]